VAAAPEIEPVNLRSGIAAKNVVPAVSSLETHTDPLWASAARLAMDNPIPVPAALVEDEDER
jgi:hypothetical protein